MKGHWCDNCHGFVKVRKKYLRAIGGNILLLPLLIALKGPYIQAKKVCKRCKSNVKGKKINLVGIALPEIVKNPDTRTYKKGKNTLRMYGIMSLIIVLIGYIMSFQEKGSMLIM